MPERHDTATTVSLPPDAAARMRQLDQLHTSHSAFDFDDTPLATTTLVDTGEHPETD